MTSSAAMARWPAAAASVQAEVDAVVGALDRTVFTQAQRSALLCQLDCVDQPNLGLEGRQQCYERCVTPVAQMQALLDAELRRIQERITKCISVCQDTAQDELRRKNATPGTAGAESIERAFDTCAASCGERQLQNIRDLRKLFAAAPTDAKAGKATSA